MLDASNIISIGAAVLSASFAVTSIFFARRSFLLAREADRRKLPDVISDFDKYLLNFDSGRSEHLYGFHVKLTNRSETNTSISTAKLLVLYDLDGIMTLAEVPSTFGAGLPKEPILLFPLRLDGRQVANGWVFFRTVPGISARFSKFHSYEVVFTDSTGTKTSFEPRLLAVTK